MENESNNSILNDEENFSFHKIYDLKYGENPHQKAGLYFDCNIPLIDFEKVFDFEFTYNDILNSNKALDIVSEFYDTACTVIVKHKNPVAVALGADILDSFNRALDVDPVSIFSATFAFSMGVDKKIAVRLSEIMPKCIIAPDFSSDAISLLKSASIKMIKLKTDFKDIKNFQRKEIKMTPFGTLIQEKDNKNLDKDNFVVVSKTKPTAEMVEDLVFAYKVVEHTGSFAVVVAHDFKTLGILSNGSNSVISVSNAIDKICDSPKDSVLATDGTLNVTDTMHIMAQNRISAIIHTGSDDNELIKLADKYGIVLINTNIRHFKY